MRLHHLALRTPDIERCVRFYRDVLGLPERARHYAVDGSVRAVWLASGEVVVMVERAAPGEPVPPPGGLDLVAFAIEPEAREAWQVRLAAAGVVLEGETAFTFYVRDPDGRRVGVSCYRFG
jgi:catechol 2,3-dioxygenase-like lactoylglutathione lyase family enzyme